MRTEFTPEQLKNPDIATSESVLRKCVHCGFCTATCPTYVLLGDELDSPRGRIYLIKDMLEHDRPASAELVRHVDRCLSCLACMTTCPSGVNYQRLVDHARIHIEETYRRPWLERLLRALLAFVMPYPRRFALALRLGALARPFRSLLPPQLRAMLELVPRIPTSPQPSVLNDSASVTQPTPATTTSAASTNSAVKPRRVAVLSGCVQSVIGRPINSATIRLLERVGTEVVPIADCCGSIVHHLGRENDSVALARKLVATLDRELRGRGLDAIIANASGCGTHIKDLAYVLRNDKTWAETAAAVAARTLDISEYLFEAGLPDNSPSFSALPRLRVAYHSACSMQHGQQLHEPPRLLLKQAGFEVVEVPEGHLCCGSAGTYNMLQPEIAGRLAARKLQNIASTGAAVVAAGNLGCLTQLGAQRFATASHSSHNPIDSNLSAAQSNDQHRTGPLKFVHTVELLDWASGGPRPSALD
jgi:glycolate oxidase iron-sulfur subunit